MASKCFILSYFWDSLGSLCFLLHLLLSLRSQSPSERSPTKQDALELKKQRTGFQGGTHHRGGKGEAEKKGLRKKAGATKTKY